MPEDSIPETVTEIVTRETTVEQPETETSMEVEEEYKWLEERLDAHTAALQSAQVTILEEVSQIRQMFQTSTEQSRTMIESLSTLVSSMSENLTTLATLPAIQSLTPPESTNTPEEEILTVETAEPENVEPMPESRAESAASKKRRRL